MTRVSAPVSPGLLLRVSWLSCVSVGTKKPASTYLSFRPFALASPGFPVINDGLNPYLLFLSVEFVYLLCIPLLLLITLSPLRIRDTSFTILAYILSDLIVFTQ